ncbi:MAG: hypothetical protein OXC92_06320 [Flavobacteriaceae bacterium]|nr:hypothetical protein [Flavobacteriaceae bacterium]
MDNQQFTTLFNAIENNKKDIKDLLEPIKEDIKGIKSDIKELKTKFDTTNNKVIKHSGLLWVFGIALGIIFTGIVNLIVNIVLNS